MEATDCIESRGMKNVRNNQVASYSYVAIMKIFSKAVSIVYGLDDDFRTGLYSILRTTFLRMGRYFTDLLWTTGLFFLRRRGRYFRPIGLDHCS